MSIKYSEYVWGGRCEVRIPEGARYFPLLQKMSRQALEPNKPPIQ